MLLVWLPSVSSCLYCLHLTPCGGPHSIMLISYGSTSRLILQYSHSTRSCTGFGSVGYASHTPHALTDTRRIFIALVV